MCLEEIQRRSTGRSQLCLRTKCGLVEGERGCRGTCFCASPAASGTSLGLRGASQLTHFARLCSGFSVPHFPSAPPLGDVSKHLPCPGNNPGSRLEALDKALALLSRGGKLIRPAPLPSQGSWGLTPSSLPSAQTSPQSYSFVLSLLFSFWNAPRLPLPPTIYVARSLPSRRSL